MASLEIIIAPSTDCSAAMSWGGVRSPGDPGSAMDPETGQASDSVRLTDGSEGW